MRTVWSVVFVAALSQIVASQGQPSRPLVSQAQYDHWQTELSNWGRWGPDDQLGTLNLVTPAKRRAALALVKDGVPVSLSTNTFFEKAVDVPCPAEWAMLTATDTALSFPKFLSLHRFLSGQSLVSSQNSEAVSKTNATSPPRPTGRNDWSRPRPRCGT